MKPSIYHLGTIPSWRKQTQKLSRPDRHTHTRVLKCQMLSDATKTNAYYTFQLLASIKQLQHIIRSRSPTQNRGGGGNNFYGRYIELRQHGHSILIDAHLLQPSQQENLIKITYDLNILVKISKDYEQDNKILSYVKMH